MPILAQHGFGDGNPGRIEAGLRADVIEGCILSPKDLSLASLQSKIAGIREIKQSAKIFFDPQYYASILGNIDGARLGNLISDYTDYFGAKHYKDLRRERNIQSEVKKVIQFQQRININEIILPGIMIQDGLKSESASIAKSFIEISDEIAAGQNISQQSWITLALGESCFRDLKSLQDLVDEITGMWLQSQGIYLLIETSNLNGSSPWCNSSVLSGQMYLVYALNLAGFKVTCGYSGLPAPYLAAAGASNIAFGWFETLRFFSLDRFMPTTSMGKRPKKKYLSRALWTRLDSGLLLALKNAHPELLNGTIHDQPFKDGSPTEKDEIVQHWDAVGTFCDEIASMEGISLRIADLRQQLLKSEQIKARIPTLSLPGFDERIAQTKGALRRFEDLAELSLS